MIGDTDIGDVQVIPCLRLLSALETDLGSMGPEVNKMMGKALNFEQDEDGGSRELLKDPDSVTVMELVKEKLKGLIDTGLLDEAKQHVVSLCLDKTTHFIQAAKRARPRDGSVIMREKSSRPPTPTEIHVNESQTQNKEQTDVKQDLSEKETTEAKKLISESVAKALVMAACTDIPDDFLNIIVDELMRKTAEDDQTSVVGRLAKTFVNTEPVPGFNSAQIQNDN